MRPNRATNRLTLEIKQARVYLAAWQALNLRMCAKFISLRIATSRQSNRRRDLSRLGSDVIWPEILFERHLAPNSKSKQNQSTN